MSHSHLYNNNAELLNFQVLSHLLSPFSTNDLSHTTTHVRVAHGRRAAQSEFCRDEKASENTENRSEGRQLFPVFRADSQSLEIFLSVI